MAAKTCFLPDYAERLQRSGRIGAWSLAADGTYWLSDYARDIHGLKKTSAVDLEAAIGYFRDDARPVLRAALERALGDGTAFDLELPFRNREGRDIFVRIQAERIQVGKALGLFGTVQDVTDSSTAFLESVISHIPHMIFVKEAKELRFVRFNQAGERLLGVKNTALLGKNDFDFFPKDQAAQFVAKDREVLAGQEIADIPEEPIDTPAGRRYLHTRKIPVRNAEGEAQYLLGISEDITERKATAALIVQQQEALVMASKLSALGEMAGGVAHEINNPLAIIHGLASKLKILAANDPKSLTPEAVCTVADRQIAVVQRISKIVSSLRSLSRDGARDEREPAVLAHIVEETLSVCRERLRAHDIELVVAPIPPDLRILCRPTQIGQVLLNLLQNAFDAVAGRKERRIELGFQNLGSSLRLSLEDSGPGIPVALREKIMQPFFTTKAVGQGTGLGLSISRSILTAHDGRLWLDTDAKATRFVVELPLEAVPEAKAS